jgi:hypothetical protein
MEYSCIYSTVNSAPNKVSWAVNFLTCIPEMPDFNIGWNITTEVLHGIPQLLHTNVGVVQ